MFDENYAHASLAALKSALADAPEDAVDVSITNPAKRQTTVSFYNAEDFYPMLELTYEYDGKKV